MTETSPLAAFGLPPAPQARRPRRHVLQGQGRPGRRRGRGARRGRGRHGAAQRRQVGRGVRDPRPVDHRLVLQGRGPGEVPRRLAPHRRRRHARQPGLHDDLGPHQGRHQVRRGVDLLGRARERRHGPSRRLRGGRHRHPRPEVVRAPAGRRRPEARAHAGPGRPGRVPGRPRAALVAARPVDLHHRGAQDERRASSTRRSCGPPTPTATTRCRARRCPSERPERGHGGHGRAARGDARGADRHGHRRAAARHRRATPTRPRPGRPWPWSGASSRPAGPSSGPSPRCARAPPRGREPLDDGAA